jgi:hypothetical protein
MPVTCAWCRKRIWFWQFEAGYLSSAVRTGKRFHLTCKAESEKHPAIAERQAEREATEALANAEAEAQIAADGLSDALQGVRDAIAGRD